MKKTVLLFLSCMPLGACALPMPVQVALWAADGFSFLGTRKSLSDHGISFAMDKDCALWRVVPEGRVCRDREEAVMLAHGAAERVSEMDEAAVEEVSEPGKGKPETDLLPKAEELAFVTASGGSGGTLDVTPVPRPEPTLMMVRQDVNLRARPSGRSSVLRALLRDQVAERLDGHDGWLKVRLLDAGPGEPREGWVDGRYLEVAG